MFADGIRGTWTRGGQQDPAHRSWRVGIMARKPVFGSVIDNKREDEHHMKLRTIAAIGAVALVGVTGCASTEETGSQQGTTADQGTVASSKKKPGGDKPKVEMTTSQKNAVASAESYLDFQAFSKKGLIQQLSSSAGDGFPEADARFAVNHIKVDWNEQAVKSAKAYLELQPLSKRELIQQLSSSAGEGFTPAQARYAADKVY